VASISLSASHAMPKDTPYRRPLLDAMETRSGWGSQGPSCRIEGRDLIYKDGIIRRRIRGIAQAGSAPADISCQRGRILALSRERLDEILVPEKMDVPLLPAGQSASFYMMRSSVGLGRRLREGLAGWTHSDDEAFILGKDGMLHCVPLGGGNIRSFIMPQREDLASMAYRDGIIFMMFPASRMLMAVSAESWDFRQIPLPESSMAGALRAEGSRILLGADHEVRAEAGPSSLELIRY